MATARPDEHPRGSWVLVVDDEPPLRAFVASVLRSAGHEVAEAHSAEQALELVMARPDAPLMLVSDIGLPGAPGTQLVERLSRLCPLTTSLLMSGSSRETLMKQGLLEKEARFLSKPFSVQQLLDRVEPLLQSAMLQDQAWAESSSTTATTVARQEP